MIFYKRYDFMSQNNPNNANCIKKTDNGVCISINLTPNASKDEILGYCDEYVKIKISAPPNENKANKKLIIFLSNFFNVPKSDVSMISGDKSRLKRIAVKNIDEQIVKQKIFVYDKIII